jgi:hypothetical protein
MLVKVIPIWIMASTMVAMTLPSALNAQIGKCLGTLSTLKDRNCSMPEGVEVVCDEGEV